MTISNDMYVFCREERWSTLIECLLCSAPYIKIPFIFVALFTLLSSNYLFNMPLARMETPKTAIGLFTALYPSTMSLAHTNTHVLNERS